MKSIFEIETRKEVINRINALETASEPKWGKMTVAQMLRHCSLCEEYYFGNIKVKRSFFGHLFGKKAIRGILKDDHSTIGKNAPTSPVFQVADLVIDFENEKQKWISLIEGYSTFNNDGFIHWFFGKMTKDQLGQFIYKHCDHHLRQFGV